jgi:drug/metabolite transporter (DMT)-like permease
LLALAGLTGVPGFAILFNVGLQYTGAGEGSVLTAFSPFVAIVAAAIILGEPLTLRRIGAGVVSLVGVFFLVLGGPQQAEGANRLLGDVLVLFAAFNWGLYSVLVRVLQQRGVGLLDMTAWSMILGVLMMVAVLPFEQRPNDWAAVTPDILAAVLYAAIFASVLAYIWWNEGVRRIGPQRASLFTNLNPIAAVTISAFLFGERFAALQAVGAALILTGLAVANVQPGAVARLSKSFRLPSKAE